MCHLSLSLCYCALSLIVGQLLNARQGLNRKILGGWVKHYENVQSSVVGNTFSSGAVVGSGGSFSSAGSYASTSSKCNLPNQHTVDLLTIREIIDIIKCRSRNLFE